MFNGSIASVAELTLRLLLSSRSRNSTTSGQSSHGRSKRI